MALKLRVRKAGFALSVDARQGARPRRSRYPLVERVAVRKLLNVWPAAVSAADDRGDAPEVANFPQTQLTEFVHPTR